MSVCLFALSILILGCSSITSAVSTSSGSAAVSSNTPTTTSATTLSLSPSTTSVIVGNQVQLAITGQPENTECSWQTSNDAILSALGNGAFQGQSAGSATATASCGSSQASASVQVTPPLVLGPTVITMGGTYSGVWNNTNPNVAAITITTDQPVIIQNSVITSKGDLIDVSGVKSGANVTIQNVTGTALDPGIAGNQRGEFVKAQLISSLIVENCTITGVSFGVNVSASTVSTVKVLYNIASQMEDRASDGNGGLTTDRPNAGHFVILGNIMAPNGAEIGWNQVIDTIGGSSTEDVVNIYKSQGAPGAPIWAHDNYFEGYSSSTTPQYNGTGLVTDGNSSPPYTAYVLFENNEMVHAAGSGVAIAIGHDISLQGNRVVSCGIDSQGNWYAMPYAIATYVWNLYGVPQSDFYNLSVQSTTGGLVRPSPTNTPMVADIWVNTSDINASDSISNQNFTDPCFVNGSLNLQAEDIERAYWAAKRLAAGVVLGDQHTE